MIDWLRLDKWPRPERSGAYSVLIVYALMYFWGFALVPHEWGDGPLSLTCYFAPWECPKQEPPPKREPMKSREHVTLLWAPNALVRKHGKDEVCFYEFNGDRYLVVSSDLVPHPCTYFLSSTLGSYFRNRKRTENYNGFLIFGATNIVYPTRALEEKR